MVLNTKDLLLIDSHEQQETISKYMEMSMVYESAIDIVKVKLDILNREYDTFKGYNPIHHIESRVKSPSSAIKKLERRGFEVSSKSLHENLLDIAGVRIICNYIEDCYTVFEALKKQNFTLIEVKDYIKNPKQTGYRSLHAIFNVPVYFETESKLVPVEIQIRTIAMDFWASLEHQLRYKHDEKTSKLMALKLKACAEMSHHLDEEMEKINNVMKKSN